MRGLVGAALVTVAVIAIAAVVRPQQWPAQRLDDRARDAGAI